jgi:hypothetical protein
LSGCNYSRQNPDDFRLFPTGKLRDKLFENGFVNLSNVFDCGSLYIMAKILDEIAGRAHRMPPPLAVELGDTSGKQIEGSPDTVQVGWLTLVDHNLKSCAILTQAQLLAGEVLGASARLSFSSLICKSPSVAGWTPWHQDAAYDHEFSSCGEEPEAITIWIPFRDVDKDTGCLCYSRFSHRFKLRRHQPIGGGSHSLMTDLDGTDCDLVTCPAFFGGATIHHRLTLHCAHPNRSPVPRKALSLNYVKDS